MPNTKEITPADRYLQYMAGWRCGAGRKTIDKARAEHSNEEMRHLYNEGWGYGRKVSANVAINIGLRFGYHPSIVRVAESVGDVPDA